MKLKKILTITLATSLCLSLAACGNNTTVVDDYGTDEGSTSIASNEDDTNDISDAASPTSTVSDALYISTGATGTLQEVLGNSVAYKDDFKIGDANFSGSLQYEIPNQDGLNIYNIDMYYDNESNEESIVKALFGDTAEKIESISYTNEYDYITLLYKYHFIHNKHKSIEDMITNQKQYFTLENDSIVINSSFPDEYKWIDKNVDDDEETYYIHMYEGDYNNCRFVLLLAYDSLLDTRYIFFEPKSIKEYFPDYDFKTLMVSGNKDQAGEQLDIANNCTDDIEILKSDAQSLLDHTLMFDGQFTVTENAFSYKMNNANYYIWMANTEMYAETPSECDNTSSILMFSNTDYISSIKAGVPGLPINYFNIAEQRDLLAEYNLTQETEKDFTNFIYTDAAKEMIDETKYVTDGYAFYIDSYNDYEEDPNAITMYDLNGGIIKYTSLGLYSIDIAISQNVTDVIENVKLQDFEHIKKSFNSEITEMLDLSQLNYPTNIKLSGIRLHYAAYFPDDDSGSYTYYPAWSFTLENTTETNRVAVVTINAMDGSIVDIDYRDYNDF
ncbi:hypothetical protein SAMN02910369_01579 [Lachnospiraceae bacterium NE2001]|nr:hypothetical protein SAMN02910369_01579 [Lachnospiraceae bacterium NE2001]